MYLLGDFLQILHMSAACSESEEEEEEAILYGHYYTEAARNVCGFSLSAL